MAGPVPWLRSSGFSNLKYNKPILPGRWLYTGLLGTSVDRSLDVVVDQSLAQGKLRLSSCPAQPAGRGLILQCHLATISIHQVTPCVSTQLYQYISCCTRVQQRCIYWNLNMTYCATRWYGTATPIICDQLLKDAKVGCNKHMQATIHTCLASFHDVIGFRRRPGHYNH